MVLSQETIDFMERIKTPSARYGIPIGIIRGRGRPKAIILRRGQRGRGPLDDFNSSFKNVLKRVSAFGKANPILAEGIHNVGGALLTTGRKLLGGKRAKPKPKPKAKVGRKKRTQRGNGILGSLLSILN
jgi:hypothetical protein